LARERVPRVLRLNLSAVDYGILIVYFVVVLGDFFLSGRSLPAWITGLAFAAVMIAWRCCGRWIRRAPATSGRS